MSEIVERLHKTPLYYGSGEASALGEQAADEIDRLTARVKALEEALTPSAATKAAYMGEFAFEEAYMDEDGNDAVRKITVPWTTVKEIMAAICARAALTPQEGGG